MQMFNKFNYIIDLQLIILILTNGIDFDYICQKFTNH
jgi:hypothetical protein